MGLRVYLPLLLVLVGLLAVPAIAQEVEDGGERSSKGVLGDYGFLFLYATILIAVVVLGVLAHVLITNTKHESLRSRYIRDSRRHQRPVYHHEPGSRTSG